MKRPLVRTYYRTGLEPPRVPTLTVEAAEKWYRLYLLLPDGTMRDIEYPDEPEYCHADESAYCDHVPNPVVVQRFALANGYEIDQLAFELMVGRWEIEYHERYQWPDNDVPS